MNKKAFSMLTWFILFVVMVIITVIIASGWGAKIVKGVNFLSFLW